MTTLSDLIARLEAAKDGDIFLDTEIFEAMFGREPSLAEIRNGGPPHYTTSLDAALTLVPEGWGAKITVPASREGSASVFNPKNGHEFDITGQVQDGLGKRVDLKIWSAKFHQSPTPALALCIAALKAREAAR